MQLATCTSQHYFHTSPKGTARALCRELTRSQAALLEGSRQRPPQHPAGILTLPKHKPGTQLPQACFISSVPRAAESGFVT